MYKISTETDSISRFIGDKETIKLIKEAGFDYFDFSLFNMGRMDWEHKCVKFVGHPLEKFYSYKRYLKGLKKYADSIGIECNQTHAPFPISVKEINKLQKRAIKATHYIGGKVVIIHPDNNASDEENAKTMKKYLKVAKKYNIIIATENMWNWDNDSNKATLAACATPESICRLVDLVNDDHFKACLDIGHAEMMGDTTNAVQLIKSLGNRMVAMHLHDNDKIHDSHQIPFSMDIDFEPIAKALKEINYSGDITLEAVSYYADHKENPKEAIENLRNAALKFKNMIEK